MLIAIICFSTFFWLSHLFRPMKFLELRKDLNTIRFAWSIGADKQLGLKYQTLIFAFFMNLCQPLLYLERNKQLLGNLEGRNFEKFKQLQSCCMIQAASKNIWNLAMKVLNFGVECELVESITSCLHSLQQRVIKMLLLGKNIYVGLRQGFVIGPLIFLIYITYLPDRTESICKIFLGGNCQFFIFTNDTATK